MGCFLHRSTATQIHNTLTHTHSSTLAHALPHTPAHSLTLSLTFVHTDPHHSPTPLLQAYIAPKAAHEPFIPAPWHLDHWDPSWPDHEPRTPNWNCSSSVCGKDHHGNIATEPLITAEASTVITGIFKNRWRTLMSVDDVIAAVIAEVDAAGQLDNTYFFYSSDHGFQLGQFNIPMDKRHVYEWDTKIHLLARGPGIKPGSTFAAPGTQVDIAPTFLGLAGLAGTARAKVMDGRSIVPFLVGGASGVVEGADVKGLAMKKDTDGLTLSLTDTRVTDATLASSSGELNTATSTAVDAVLPDSVRRHLAALGNPKAYAANWRTDVFIEYYYCQPNIKCMSDCTGKGTYPKSDTDCTSLANNSACWTPVCQKNCYATEDTTNNFIGLRSLPTAAAAATARGGATGVIEGGIHTASVGSSEASSRAPNTLYAEFQTGDLSVGDINFDAVDFVEYVEPTQSRVLYSSSDDAMMCVCGCMSCAVEWQALV